MATPIPPNNATFTLSEILEASGGTAFDVGHGVTVVGVSTSSREISAGKAFLALVGEHTDGHVYLKDAHVNGAVLSIVERGKGVSGLPRVEVPDTLVVWGAIAAFHRSRWKTAEKKILAVTGSAGKTTTKEFTAALLRSRAKTLSTVGNLNNRIGVPATLLTLTDETFAMIETGMSLPGEIAKLGAIVRPDVAIVTNIGLAHSEGVGGIEGVQREKGDLFRSLSASGTMIVNVDDERVKKEAGSVRAASIFVGSSTDLDPRTAYRLLRVSSTPAGESTMTFSSPTIGQATLTLPLMGDHIAFDLLLALAAVEQVSRPFTLEELSRVMADFRPASGRGEIRKGPNDVWVIDDSYNANPSSMAASLRAARELVSRTGRRLIVVLGEMKELGDDSVKSHEELGELVAQAQPAVFLGCGGVMSLTVDRAKKLGIDAKDAGTSVMAAQEAAAIVRPGDLVLVKGSRSTHTEVVVETILKAP